YQEERWAKWDEPAIKAAIEAAGGTYISNDAKSSAETQASNLENLISQGAKALIVLAQDGTAILPAVTSAIDSGIPVVAYDRLIEEPRAFYLTFDNQGVGRIEAEEIFKRVPKGKYVLGVVRDVGATGSFDCCLDGGLIPLRPALFLIVVPRHTDDASATACCGGVGAVAARAAACSEQQCARSCENGKLTLPHEVPPK
ncbi:MAG: hypothetical protein EBY96_02415, partial [Actinobacteria bacterium]|nr:hypothetical protein [Actinomycetota bacterium]